MRLISRGGSNPLVRTHFGVQLCQKKIFIIGSGFSSLSSACYLAKEGHSVTIFEKNKSLVEGQDNLKKMVLLLTWVQVGIGCLMFLKSFLVILTRRDQISMN